MGTLGKVHDVVLVTAGAELDRDCLSTDTTLYLSGIEDFNETGGLVTIGSSTTPVTYSAVLEQVDYSVDAEGADSPSIYTMTLASAVGTAYAAGTRINLSPKSEQKVAHVLVVNSGDEPVEAVLPHEISILITDGVREPGAQETVEIAPGGDGELYVTRLVGNQIQILSSELDLVPLPTPDGTPPGQVVGVTSQGGIRSVFLFWPAVANHDSVTYKVHGSTVSGFTPSASTLLNDSVVGGQYAAKQAWDPTAGALVSLQPTVSYYFRVIATDVDGDGTASAEISGAPLQVSSDDISVNAVTADKILANAITADRFAATLAMVSALQVGAGISIDPVDGIKISLTGGGLIQFPADGSDAVVQAILRARSLVVDDHMTVYGANNAIEGGIVLSGGITAPGAPRVSKNWVNPSTYLTISPGTGLGGWGYGMYDNGTAWVICSNYIFSGIVLSIDKSTGVATQLTGGWTNVNFLGVAKTTSGDWFVLASEYGSAGSGPKIYKFNSSWTRTAVISGFSTNSFDQCSLGVSGNTIYLVQKTAATSKLYVKPYNTATSAWGTTVEMGSGTDWSQWEPTGLVYDSGSTTDIGIACFVISAVRRDTTPAQTRHLIFTTAGARQMSLEWTSSIPGMAHGLAWDGTRFHQLSYDASRVWHFARKQSTSAFSITTTRYDSDTTGGTHETTASAATSYTVPLRTWTLVETDPPGDGGGTDDPDTVRIYVNNHKQAELAAGATSALYDIFDLTGSGAPTTNGFIGVGAPGQITSETTDTNGALVSLKGDGASWRLGNLAQAESGIITASAALEVSGSSTGTPSFASGWSANSITVVRRAGFVTLSFVALKKSTAPTAGETICTIPTGYRQPSALGELWLTPASGVANSGGGVCSYIMSISTAGLLAIRSTTGLPAANESMYGSITYPVSY